MKFDRDIEAFIKNYSKEIEEENAAIFAGAGLSVGAGYVNWKELLEPVAEELGLNVEKEHDLVSLAQFHENDNGNRSKLNKVLLEEFGDLAKPTRNHELIARLPISTIWTTNYDRLIETAVQNENKTPDIKYTEKHLSQTKPGRDVTIYKMHGDIEHPSEAILTKDDYEKYHQSMGMYLTTLSGDLISKTLLFIGFSFTDPNLDYILSRVRVSVSSKDLRQHYAIIKKIRPDDFEDEADFDYDTRRQELFVQDLKRFGIKALLVEDYGQITDILERIYSRHRSRSVFISGAAHTYGSWNANSAETLVRKISAQLIEKNFRVVSGFGLGVGSAVIAGALDQIYTNLNKHIGNKLILRPFAQGDENRKLYRQYREDIMSLAGVAIFLFGNKLEDGKVIESTGIEEEFEIAVQAGLFVIPIGVTGFVAQKLWRKVIDNFEAYYPKHAALKSLFEHLGDESKSSDEEITSTIMQIMQKLGAA